MKGLLLFFFCVTTNTLLFSQSANWEEQNEYSNGFARVFNQGKFSFINNRRELISPFVFEDARNFRHGLAAVKQYNKWGFINERAKAIVSYAYDIVFDFNETVTVVNRGAGWWLIDTKGTIIKQLDITLCKGFKNGTAIVFNKDKKGTLYKDGSIVYDNNSIAAKPSTIPYSTTSTSSTTSCPDNLDFEFGDFTNWQCYTGHVDSIGTTNVITVTPSAPTPGRHTMYARANPSAIDPFGLFPTNPPDGSNFAVKLGNTQVGAQAERIRYTIHVPLNDSNFSFRYHYAVVLQDPGHTVWTQPRFTAKLFDSTANAYIDCASFEYISTSNLPGFLHSTVDTSVIYKDWSPVFISLRGYAGKTIFLDFTTADCVRRAHWGYAYVDVQNMCGQAIQMQYQCDSPHVATLTGPPGFQYYNWWSQGYTTLLGTGQQVTLNPGPPPNSLLWLEMIPFANFGCLDTIPVRINGISAAHFSANDTMGVCAPHSFTFYNSNPSANTAIWDFGDNTGGTGDTVTHVYTNPGVYIVTLTVPDTSGCNGQFIDTVRVLQPTGSFSYAAGNFCNSMTAQFSANTSYADSLFWTFGDGAFLNTTQSNVSHTYSQPGIYVPHLVIKSNQGCQLLVPGADTIRVEKLLPGFTSNIQRFCGSSNVVFTDTSHAFFGITNRQWDFGDGTTGSGTTVSHTYTTAGTYTIKLVVTSALGCKDSVIKAILIQVNNKPVASIAGDTVRCANSTITFTGDAVSADPISQMNWTCSNGTSGSGSSFTVTFNTAGTFTLRLIAATVNGCFDTAYHIIRINPLPTAIISGPATVCQDAAAPVITFTGSGGVAPYTFTFNINGGPVQVISTVSGNTVSLPVLTNTPGQFTYNLLWVQESSQTSCSQNQGGSVNIVVNPLPTASISGPATVCQNASSPTVTFTGASGTAPYTFVYKINGGAEQTITSSNGNSATVTVPTNVAGSFLYLLVRVTDASSTLCSQPQNGSALITVSPLPTASITGNAAVCVNAQQPVITFTGSGSTAPYTFTYTINGGPEQNISTTAGSNSVSIIAPTNAAGVFTYTLVKVKDGSSTACSQPQNGSVTITVNPLPAATISGDAVLCLNSPQPVVTFTGSGGTAPYTFTYRLNNGPQLTVSSSGGNSATITAPTSAPGTFTYALLQVQDASSTACSQPQSGTVIIKINPLPTATISNPASVCQHAAAPMVTFTGAGSTAPYTFTYTINGGAEQTVVSNNGNSVSIPVSTDTAGTFIYALVKVQDASSTSCSQLQSGSVTITVQPTPAVDAGIDRSLCQGSSVQLNATGAAQYSWSPSAGLSCSNCANPLAHPADTIIYHVTGTSAFGCMADDTVKINVIKPFPMLVSPGDTLCQGEKLMLKASGANTYLWSPATGLDRTNIATPMASPSSTTTYRVIGFDGHNCFADTAYVKVIVGPWPTVNAGPDITMPAGNAVTLSAIAQNGPIIQWLWEPSTGLSCTNCSSPNLNITTDMSYRVTVTNQYHCVAQDVINIFSFCKSAQVFVPNAFTPDGDGLNDILMVRGKGIHVVYFRVFSRWGELVFEAKDCAPNEPRFGWDGKIRGVPAPPDVFVYTAQVICDNNVVHTIKGNTTILK